MIWSQSVCFDQLLLILYPSSLRFYVTHRHENSQHYAALHSLLRAVKQGFAQRTVSWCHARGIPPCLPHRENYSDAFRCPLSHAFSVLLGAEGEAKWMWQAQIKCQRWAVSHTLYSFLDSSLISHFHALPSALPTKCSLQKNVLMKGNGTQCCSAENKLILPLIMVLWNALIDWFTFQLWYNSTVL